MPYIKSSLSGKLCTEEEQILKEELGKAISILSGKSEQWLMLNFEDNCHLWFKGKNNEPLAMIEVKIFGKSSADEVNQLTNKITDIYHRVLKIKPEHIYIQYDFCPYWGWNGNNF